MKSPRGSGYGLVVHGDAGGVEPSRRALSGWLDWMGLIDAGDRARLDRYIGYYEPCATSHQSLDTDEAAQKENRNVARYTERRSAKPDFRSKRPDFRGRG